MSTMAVSASEAPKVQDIWVAYDIANDGVTVTPEYVAKGTAVRFLDPNKGKLRIVFLSPAGEECDQVPDSQVTVMTIEGTYHFKCFFTPVGGTHEFSPKNGGVIIVSPTTP